MRHFLNLIVVSCVAFTVDFVFVPTLLAQKEPDHTEEIDQWQGSSLGIRIAESDGDVFVKEVHDHVSDDCPLHAGDRIISIGELDVSSSEISDLAGLLETTDPGTTLQIKVEREGETEEVSLTTYRRELVDIVEIVERLSSNEIVKNRLQETGREDFMDSMSDRMFDAVQKSQSPRKAAEAMNAIIDEIDVSHIAILPAQSYSQLRGGTSGDLGWTLQRHSIDGEERYFVVDRMPGSSGYESDVLLGDEIVSLNSVKLERSKRLILSGQEHRRRLFFIQVDPGEQIQVEFRRRQNSETQSVKLEARPAVPAEDVLNLSARVIDSGQNQYGYMRFWNLMSVKSPKIASDIIEEKFADCDMLILDLRGRGGLIPVVMSVESVVRRSEVPVVAITDDLTRSAKEMLSLLIKKQAHVTVVGQTTAGAVTGATMTQLPSGNGFMFPVLSSDSLKRFTGDVVIEGNGVEPDIEVDFQIPFCGGNDRLLEAAIETADDQIREFLETIIF